MWFFIFMAYKSLLTKLSGTSKTLTKSINQMNPIEALKAMFLTHIMTFCYGLAPTHSRGRKCLLCFFAVFLAGQNGISAPHGNGSLALQTAVRTSGVDHPKGHSFGLIAITFPSSCISRMHCQLLAWAWAHFAAAKLTKVRAWGILLPCINIILHDESKTERHLHFQRWSDPSSHYFCYCVITLIFANTGIENVHVPLPKCHTYLTCHRYHQTQPCRSCRCSRWSCKSRDRKMRTMAAEKGRAWCL